MGANHKCVSLRAKTHLDVHTAAAVMASEPFRIDLPLEAMLPFSFSGMDVELTSMTAAIADSGFASK